MWRDVRGALRSLARRPGFAVAVLLTLAFGIGANSAVFTVVNAVLLRDLPFTNPDRLVAVDTYRLLDGILDEWRHSYANFLDLKEGTGTFEELVAYSESVPLNLTTAGETRHVWGEMVSAGYFELLGITPFLGRTFQPDEDRLPAGDRVAVISHSLWKTYYENQRSLGERSIRLVDDVFVVVGVAPPNFHGLGDRADVWVPVTTARSLLGMHYVEKRDNFWLLAAGRLLEGVSLKQAQAAMDTAVAGLRKDHPKVNEGIGLRIEMAQEAWFGDLRLALTTLMAGAGFVLLIACTNISNLLLARTLERRREMAIRTALGGSRWRLIRQVLTESVALALSGGFLGLVLAYWTTDLLIASSAIDIPDFLEAGVDLQVIGVMAAVSIVCGVGFGLVPALTSSRLHLSETLKEGGRTPGSSSRHLLQSTLIVGEILLAFALLAAAAHTLQEFNHIRNTDLGFRSDNLMTLRLGLSGKAYAGRAARSLAADRLVKRLASFPEAEAVAVAGPSLPIDDLTGTYCSIENLEEPVVLQFHSVSVDYFDLLGIPKVDGRTFLETDVALPKGQPVAVISESIARRFWPGESAVGRRIRPGKPEADNKMPWFSIVGVVADIDQSGFGGAEDYPDLYYPVQQHAPGSSFTLNVMVRSERLPDSDMLARLRAEIGKVTPDLPAYDVLTIEQRLADQITNNRFLVLLMSLFTSLALILAAVGIYGLLAYIVTRKNREFGIRLALGSQRRALFQRIVRQAALLGASGIVAGTVLTLALRTILASRVHKLIGTDPLILAGISLLLLLLALGASLLPAWRATRIDPNSVLREE